MDKAIYTSQYWFSPLSFSENELFWCLSFYFYQTVQVETELEPEARYSQDLQKTSEYIQSKSSNSLYCMIQTLQKLSLADNT